MAAVMTGVLIALVICLSLSFCGGFKKKAKPWGPKVLLGIWAVIACLVFFTCLSTVIRGSREDLEIIISLLPTYINLVWSIGATFYIYYKLKTRKN